MKTKKTQAFYKTQHMDLPPVGWGTLSSSWEELISRWLARPRKERRAFPGKRISHWPWMNWVTLPTSIEVCVKYAANEFCAWNKSHTRLEERKGYYAGNYHGTKLKYLGENKEDVVKYIQECYNTTISRLEGECERVTCDIRRHIQVSN